MIGTAAIFTFQYASIKQYIDNAFKVKLSIFTFQYASIKRLTPQDGINLATYLHFNMLLLNG